MKIYNNYILITAVALLLTTVLLVAIGQNAIDVYVTIYLIETFVITELYVYFSVKARRELAFIGVILFGILLLVVALEVVELLA
jgi:hypothetical protein